MPSATLPRAAASSTAPVPAGGLLGARTRALAFDLATMLAASVMAGMVAAVWLLVRTSAGTVDAGAADSAIAFAIVMSAVPAWYAAAVLDVRAVGATPGQRRAGVRVEGGTVARHLRLTISPVAMPGWLWLATVAGLSGLDALTPAVILLTAAAIGVLGAGLASAVLIALGHVALHDRVAGTRLVRA